MTVRRQMGLRRRIAVAAAAAAAAALLAVLVLVGPGLRARALDRERAALLAEARLMARVVEEARERGVALEDLDPLIDEAAREIRARATIIALDGRVLADSAVAQEDLPSLENHATRPEVLEALARGSGSNIRRSATIGQELMYGAVTIGPGARPLAVSRVAHSLRDIEEQVGDLRRSVALSLLVAFLITAVLSAVFSSSLIGPLREIMDAARRLGAGDLTTRIRVRRDDELGELAYILNQAADRLQERLTELARDRARTAAILGAMEEGLLAVDHKGTVLVANEALREHFGLEEPVGRHYLEAIRQREVAEVIEHVLGTGERRTAEVEIPHRGRVFAATGLVFPGAEDAPHGAVLTLHDITERRRLDRVRRDFVANASHELRTPLTSIRGFVEALEDGAVSDPGLGPRFLGKIHAQADRMAVLADDLLELSRLESDPEPPALGSVAVAELATSVSEAFADRAADKQLELLRRDEGAPVVTTDAERLRRILDNLVDNALKYTPEGGRVEVVSAPVEGGGAVVHVIDNGPGIPAEHLPRLFERFYRVDKARSRELGGTGLGLSIARHLAESVGARLTVESTLGVGSRFSVRLP